MKKVLILSSLAAAVILTGCGGGGGGGDVPPPPPVEMDVLYLDDNNGGLAGVPYMCDGRSGFTDEVGAFYFYPGENCTFDLTGFDGSMAYLWDPLYIDDSAANGIEGIGYDCWSGTGGFTDISGYFEYDMDDECTFYL
ncbi:MAG: hypothetical protein U9R27_09625 [Campylobacterota bacterium]|nr:hypothetical protein [Campylobacterota bacterium]